VSLGVLGQAVSLFAVTNIDDIVILALFFAQGAGHRGATWRIAAGQYLGFVAILVVAVAGALGATLLPRSAIPYLGLLPLALGLRAAWTAWRDRAARAEVTGPGTRGPKMLEVASVTFANGGDNIGVYLPVFAAAGAASVGFYSVVFLILVAVLLVAGRYFATRPVIAQALSRWGHIVLPVVLIGIGVLILIDG
jgi:cadmium resistance protein CadD (predicted permease)